jgi:NADPH-dependent 2,4-dienoyl-CoA reductase/sulfur reductase-like enzyme
MSAPVVIVGTGLAGYNLAKEWRKLDTQTPLLLITADDGRSYSKPMLSTGFGKNKDADGLAMAEAGAMAEQLNAEIRTHTCITGIDPGHKRLWIGEVSVPNRDLVLAWGAEPMRVPVQGDAQDARVAGVEAAGHGVWDVAELFDGFADARRGVGGDVGGFVHHARDGRDRDARVGRDLADGDRPLLGPAVAFGGVA